MLDHVGMPVSDYTRSKAFYLQVLRPLGYDLVMEVSSQQTGADSGAGFGAGGRPQFWIVKPIDKNPATVGNGITVGLDAPDRPSVDAAYKAGMQAGGKDEGAPGLRTHYHPNYYGAYLRDTDGNKVCIVCHKPA